MRHWPVVSLVKGWALAFGISQTQVLSDVEFSIGPKSGLWLTKHTNPLGTPNLQSLFISKIYSNEINKVHRDIEPKA